MQNAKRPLGPMLALFFNATVWGLVWLPFKTLQGLGIHPLWSTALVYATALCGLLLWRPRALQYLLRKPWLLGLALAAGLTNVCFNWGITTGDVVRVTLLFYMMPVWSIALAWPLLGERPTGRALLRVVLAVIGVMLVLQRPGAGWPLPREAADWLGLAGGFCFAVTNILVRRWRAVPEEGRVLAMFVGGLTVSSLLAFGGAGGNWPGLSVQVLPWVVGVGLAFVAGNLALQYGAARLAAQVTALIMLSEVLIATLSSSLLGASQPTPTVWMGGALIVLAAALAVRRS